MSYTNSNTYCCELCICPIQKHVHIFIALANRSGPQKKPYIHSKTHTHTDTKAPCVFETYSKKMMSSFSQPKFSIETIPNQKKQKKKKKNRTVELQVF